MKRIILKYYLYVQAFKKIWDENSNKDKRTISNFFRKTKEKQHFGNVGAHGCLKL